MVQWGCVQAYHTVPHHTTPPPSSQPVPNTYTHHTHAHARFLACYPTRFGSNTLLLSSDAGTLLLVGAFGTFIISVVFPTLATFHLGPYSLHSAQAFRVINGSDDDRNTVNPIVEASGSPVLGPGLGSKSRARGNNFSIERAASTRINLDAQEGVVFGGKLASELTLLDYLQVGMRWLGGV